MQSISVKGNDAILNISVKGNDAILKIAESVKT